MSPLWRRELRVGVCPNRLVTPKGIKLVEKDPTAELRELGQRSRLCVVLSNHFVRYAVLPYKQALRSTADWDAYARHAFESTYGAIAGDWRISVAPAKFGEPRVASAADGVLIDALRTIDAVVSIQPYLVAAYNARRRALGQDGWFVLQEPERLTLGLLCKGTWKRIRVRHAAPDWPGACADLLEREVAAYPHDDSNIAFVCAEDEPPSQLGRFRVVDVTMPRGMASVRREHVMTLH